MRETGSLENPSLMSSDVPALAKNGADCAYSSIWTAGLAEVDSGVPDNDVDAARVVVLPHLDDLPERVGSHGDQVLAAPAANIPQRCDLDLPARRHDRGIDDQQFPMDVGAAYPKPRGGLVGKGVALVWTMAVSSANMGRSRPFISRAPRGRVANFDQTHDQVR